MRGYLRFIRRRWKHIFTKLKHRQVIRMTNEKLSQRREWTLTNLRCAKEFSEYVWFKMVVIVMIFLLTSFATLNRVVTIISLILLGILVVVSVLLVKINSIQQKNLDFLEEEIYRRASFRSKK